MENVVLSVILPMYNSEAFIERTLNSILAQTFTNIEVVCIDDCSKDNTFLICQNISKKDTRVRVIRNKENSGVSYSRNIGLDNAKGEYVAFVDHDDFLDSTMYEKLIYKIKESDADVVHCNVKLHHNGNIQSSLMPKDLKKVDMQFFFLKNILIDQLKSSYPFGQYACTIWNKIYKTETIRHNKIFFKSERVYGYEDFVFNLEFFLKTDNVVFCPEPLYNHIYYSTSLGGCSSYTDLNLTCRNWKLTESIIKNSAFKDNKKLYNYFLLRVWQQTVFSIKNDITRKRFSRINKILKSSQVKQCLGVDIADIRLSFWCNLLSHILFYYCKIINR